MTHGEIWWVDFGVPVGSLPAKLRPAIIVQHESLHNSDLNTVVVVPLTSNMLAADYEPNILLFPKETGLKKDSVAVIHLVGAVNKFSFVEKISKLSHETYTKIVGAIDVFMCGK